MFLLAVIAAAVVCAGSVTLAGSSDAAPTDPCGDNLEWSFHGDTDLYAQGDPATIDVTFYADGYPAETITQTYGWDYKLPDDPTKTGYTFNGWYTGEDGKGTKITKADTVEATEDFDLYAYFQPNTIYVKFYCNGTVHVAIAETYDDYYVLPTDLTKKGHTPRWFTEEGGGGDEITADDRVDRVKGFSVYVFWDPVKYTVTLDPAGGEVSGEPSVVLTYGQPVNIEQTAVLSGYGFKGWFTEAEGGEEVENGSNWLYTDIDTLYAHWEPSSYLVTFDPGDGTLSGGPAQVTAIFGNAFTFGQTAELAGLKFLGWFTAEEGGDQIVSGDIWSIPNDQTLYAHWKNMTVAVVFNPGPGTVIGSSEAKAVLGEEFVFEQTAELTGFKFLGWFTAEKGGDQVVSGEIWTFETATVLYAHWEANSYKATFDANGGELHGSQYVFATFGSAFEFTTDADRPGYTFVEWNTDGEGKGASFESGDTWNFADDTTLYAIWTADTYTVTFDANGGTLVGEETAEAAFGQKFEFGQTAERTGYVFAGWFTAENSKVRIESGSEWTIPNDQTLYAHWNAKKITVSFYDGDTLMGTQTETYDGTYILVAEPSKTGYTFAGWFTEGGTQIKTGDKVEAADDLSLFAEWTAVTYTVTFDANGGTLVGEETAEAAYGQEFVFGQTAERTGYGFVGWFTAKEGGTEIGSGDEWTIPGDQTLYARWEANTITVSFYDGDTLLGTQTETYDGTYILVAKPSKTGYTFAGWFTEGDVQIKAGDKVESTEDLSLFAKWTADTYTVTFDANGGSEIPEGKETQTATYDAAFDIGTEKTSRTGYELAGWFTAAEGGTEIASGGEWTIPHDQTLYAHWNAKEITVSFYDGDTLLGTQTETYDGAYILVAEPSKTGYTFAGWFTEGDVQIRAGDKVESTEDLSLFAKWTADTYTVTFDANGGTLAGEETAEATFGQKFEFGQTAERTGYGFVGWFTAKEGGDQIASGDEWTVPGDQTLYAHWNAKEITVSFYDGETLLGTQTETYDGKYILIADPSEPGYLFEGWFTDEGKQIKAGDRVEAAEDFSLYAGWIVHEYTVTFDANGGTEIPEEKRTQKAIVGEEFVIGAVTTLTGHSLVGWFTAKEDGIKIESGSEWTIPHDQTLYARWEANKITVSFYDGETLLGTKTETYGGSYDLLADIPRTGHTFGWFTEGGDQIKAGDKVEAAEDFSLYATWTANTYTVTFDADGGTLVGEETAEAVFGQEFVFGQKAERTGYGFVGWFTAGGVGVVSGNNWELAQDTDLYARWEANKITVSFYDGGKLLGTQTETYDSTYVLVAEPSKTGYNFAGWFTEEGGKGTEITAEKTVEATESFNVYANWTAKTFYLAFFDGKESLGEKEQTYGEKYQLIDAPGKTGYSFAGWFTEKGGKDSEITADMTVEVTEEFSVYAKWTGDKITVSFYDGDTLLGTKTETYGSKYLLIADPSKMGHTFCGWFTAKEGGDPITAESEVGVMEDHSLYARWSANMYTVTFDANGGSEIPEGEKVQTATFGTAFIIGEDKTSLEGYVLAGWFTAKERGTEIVSRNNWDLAQDTTLYAHWTEIVPCTVSFNPNGGTLVGEETAEATCGQVFEFDQTAERTGYGFVGWFTAKKGGDRIESGDVWESVSDTMVLYAHWEANTTKVHFDANGGTTKATDMTVTYDQPSGITFTASRTDYDFKGWNTEADGSGEFIGADTLWKYDCEEMTLYAHWDSNPHASVTVTMMILVAAISIIVVAVTAFIIRRFGS